jgi:lysophospholipase L1-like esterase
LRAISAQQWVQLSQRAIYFGHQSVGANIVQGLDELLADRRDIPLRIISAGRADTPGLHEFYIGENGNPASKLRSFAETLERDKPPVNSILVMKFCYVDMTNDTNVNALFAEYKASVDQLRVRYPGREIVHVTMPLTTVESAPKFLIKELLGRPSRRRVNAMRNQFNRLLRSEYVDRDPVFDLAEYESTGPDGSRTSYTLGKEVVYAMASEWSSDGGHLNALGRREVAKQFLLRLAELPPGQPDD